MPPFTPLSNVRKLRRLLDHADRKTLSPTQKYMYNAEKQMNFRTIAKLCATRSDYVLGTSNLASPDLIEEMAQVGQFAEVVYPSLLPTEFVFENLNILTQANFPLEGYDALLESELLQAWQGDVADLDSLIAYRPALKQLVVAFSGTSNMKQSLYDVRLRRLKHPAGRGCGVHSGFWRIYKGVRSRVLEGIKEGVNKYDVKELAITGHSLGGAISSLLALDLLTANDVPRTLLDGVTLKLFGFGSPRAGNSKLVKVWRDAVAQRRAKEGEHCIKEYLVKAYRDGVPSLPPASFRYQHFTEEPLYFYHGRLFHIPVSENEHGLFHVAKEALDTTQIPQYPRGGHNYYNNRDMEGIARRMQWIEEMMAKGPDWESSYTARKAKYEEKLAKKVGMVSPVSSRGSSITSSRTLESSSGDSWTSSSTTLEDKVSSLALS
ncbi:Alpha/Beta hydrolase protein [Cytidiella melzeri]|nr:Alpha/Beta hydrolase protein [Cytidiella melzeri]